MFYANPVPLAQQMLQQVSGAGQVSTGQSFQPVVVRVVDSATSPHPVMAAPVSFLTTVLRPGGMVPGVGGGDTNPGNPAMPVILKVTQRNASSDTNGLASVVPSSGGFSAPAEVDVQASAGTNAVLDDPLLIFPAVSTENGSAPVKPPIMLRPIRGPLFRDEIGAGQR